MSDSLFVSEKAKPLSLEWSHKVEMSTLIPKYYPKHFVDTLKLLACSLQHH